jgi:hypothetical protein
MILLAGASLTYASIDFSYDGSGAFGDATPLRYMSYPITNSASTARAIFATSKKPSSI